MTAIGWYIHHHGQGHLTRFLAVRPHLDAPVVAFSSLPEPAALPADTTWVSLPRDDDPLPPRAGGLVDADPTVGGMLHWAPLRHPGHRRRLARIAEVSVARDLSAFVVDVSVEVTLWVRLLGVPTVVVSQPGDRTDAAHTLAYRAADRILAPWAEGTVGSAALEAVRTKVRWTGGISRFDGRLRPPAQAERTLLVLGRVLAPDTLAAMKDAGAGAGWTVSALGADAHSWSADPWHPIASSTVVVSAAGQNSIADLAAAGARSVVIAQERPFAEQESTAAVLHERELAVVGSASDSPARVLHLAERARSLEPAWDVWGIRGASARAAAVIAELAR